MQTLAILVVLAIMAIAALAVKARQTEASRTSAKAQAIDASIIFVPAPDMGRTCRFRVPTAHNLSEVHCGWPAGASPVPLNTGTRVWGPVGGIDAAMIRNPFMGTTDDFLAGDPRSADTARENLR